jgi:hypothetical protein
VLDREGRPVAFFEELLDAALAQRDDRDFSSGQRPVEQDDGENDDGFGKNGRLRSGAVSP